MEAHLRARLVCIDPARVDEFWLYADDFIRSAIERTGINKFEEIEADVLAGNQLLWLAVSDRIEAAATTHLSNNVCTITACGGNVRERWLPLIAEIEAYAKAEGCRCSRVIGRRGWEKALDGYHVSHVILERDLDGRKE